MSKRERPDSRSGHNINTCGRKIRKKSPLAALCFSCQPTRAGCELEPERGRGPAGLRRARPTNRARAPLAHTVRPAFPPPARTPGWAAGTCCPKKAPLQNNNNTLTKVLASHSTGKLALQPTRRSLFKRQLSSLAGFSSSPCTTGRKATFALDIARRPNTHPLGLYPQIEPEARYK